MNPITFRASVCGDSIAKTLAVQLYNPGDLFPLFLFVLRALKILLLGPAGKASQLCSWFQCAQLAPSPNDVQMLDRPR